MASAPPKARPRPRARPKVAASSSDTLLVPPSKGKEVDWTGTAASPDGVISIDDDEDDFLNHFRHARAVAEDGAMRASANPPGSPSPAHHDTGDYSDDGTSSSKKRRTGSQGGSPHKKKVLNMPAWTLGDDGYELPGESSKLRASFSKPGRDGKLKTPAPASAPIDLEDVLEVSSGSSEPEITILPPSQPTRPSVPILPPASQSIGLRSGQAALRQQQDAAYNPFVHPPIQEEPDDEDSFVYDPARDAEIQALLAGRTTSARAAAEEEEEMPEVEVVVTVQWHIGDEEGKAMSVKAKEVLTKKRSVKMRTPQPIEVIYDFVLNTMGQARDKIVLAYNGAKIYGTSQTLQQLRIFKDCQIDGYSMVGWAEQQQSDALRRKELEEAYTAEGDAANNSAAGPSAASADAEPEEPTDTLSLSLRGKETVSVKAKPATKLSSLVEHYARKTGVRDASTLRLKWEGETADLSRTVADLELEDDDMLDIVGG